MQTDQQSLVALFNKAKTLQQINELVLNFIPPTHRQACQVANIYGTTLVIFTSNAAVATELRLNKQDYLSKFKTIAKLRSIRDIQLKVRPSLNQTNTRFSQKEKSNMPLLSKETASLVDDIADGIADKKVKESLKRIAKHHK